MANSRQMIALLKSHVRRDDQEFLSIAMEMAATEARQGHTQVAETLKGLIEEARRRPESPGKPLLVVPNRSELSSLLSSTESDIRLSDSGFARIWHQDWAESFLSRGSKLAYASMGSSLVERFFLSARQDQARQ